jgi:hypothetical protein
VALSALVPQRIQFGPAANVSMGVLAWSGTPITTVATLLPAALDAMVYAYPCKQPITTILLSEVAYTGYSNPGVADAYQAGLSTVLDLLHAKWPDALIYVSRTWQRGRAADCDDWAARIAVEVGLRPTYAREGDDERVWLENGDDGALLTSDGVHYSIPAGVNAKAAQVKAVLGY